LKIGDKFGLVDARSMPLTPVQFDAFAGAGPGVKNVKIDGKWGRIGLDGRWLLEPKFDYLSGGGDIFVASIDGKRGFMRSDGTWLVEPKFDAARSRGDTAFVSVSGATGCCGWRISPGPFHRVQASCATLAARSWRKPTASALSYRGLERPGSTSAPSGSASISISAS
jgi:hypothetical protein